MNHFQTFIRLLTMLFFSVPVLAQDSTRVLSAEQFIAIVRQYHPVALQAQNNIEQARAGITAARAFFDPVLQTEIAEKMFDGKQYYRYTQPQVTVPTWFGIELYAGTEHLAGSRINPEETPGRTSYAGVSVPLLKDLLIDKRRATLQQAKILQRQSEAERRGAMNNLLQEALNAYWDWMQQQRLKIIIDDLVTVNEQRLRLIKTSVQLGDRAAIDTIEALAQLQSFLSLQQEQEAAVQNARLTLSFFLWTPQTSPYLLPPDVQPAAAGTNTAPFTLTATDSLLQVARAQHPELQQYDFKLASLTIEQRLKFQSLLPKLNLKYNQLGKGYNVAKTAAAPLLQNNYQYGISFALPLRLSEGRGAYRQAKLKLQNVELDRTQKMVQIENKVKTYFNKLQALQAQLVIQQSALQNYQTLQRAEETRFFSGESSLFLINTRENKVLEAQQKLIELQTKLAQARIDLQWAAGTLHSEVRL